MANVSSAMEAAASLPSCVIPCLLDGFAAFGCDISNILTCYCPNIPLNYNVSSCVQLSCNAADQAAAETSHHETCIGIPIPSKTNEMRTPLIVLNTTCWMLAVLRFVVRWKITKKFWWDDWTMLVAVATNIVISVFLYELLAKGLGKHVWDLNYDNVADLYKLYYATELLYVFSEWIIKCSLVFVYLRIFTDRNFRRWCWVTQIFLAVAALVFFFLLGFRCKPTRASWEDPINANTKCMSFTAITLGGAVISVAEDIWILLLPIHELYLLQLNRSKKIQLVLMFNIGILACITGIIRLKYVANYRYDDTDQTYDKFGLTFWSIVEITVALYCANIPPIRPLLRIMGPMVLGSNFTDSDNAGLSPIFLPVEVVRNGNRMGILECRTNEYSPESLLDLIHHRSQETIESTSIIIPTGSKIGPQKEFAGFNATPALPPHSENASLPSPPAFFNVTPALPPLDQ